MKIDHNSTIDDAINAIIKAGTYDLLNLSTEFISKYPHIMSDPFIHYLETKYNQISINNEFKTIIIPEDILKNSLNKISPSCFRKISYYQEFSQEFNDEILSYTKNKYKYHIFAIYCNQAINEKQFIKILELDLHPIKDMFEAILHNKKIDKYLLQPIIEDKIFPHLLDIYENKLYLKSELNSNFNIFFIRFPLSNKFITKNYTYINVKALKQNTLVDKELVEKLELIK